MSFYNRNVIGVVCSDLCRDYGMMGETEKVEFVRQLRDKNELAKIIRRVLRNYVVEELLLNALIKLIDKDLLIYEFESMNDLPHTS